MTRGRAEFNCPLLDRRIFTRCRCCVYIRPTRYVYAKSMYIQYFLQGQQSRKKALVWNICSPEFFSVMPLRSFGRKRPLSTDTFLVLRTHPPIKVRGLLHTCAIVARPSLLRPLKLQSEVKAFGHLFVTSRPPSHRRRLHMRFGARL